MEWITQPEAWIAFLTLTALELVLGIDNIVFISILAGKLPNADSRSARARIGLAPGDVHAHRPPVLAVVDHPADGAALRRAAAGNLRPRPHPPASADCSCSPRARTRSIRSSKARRGMPRRGLQPSFASVIVQILLLDIVFSLDSVITAVGMVDRHRDHDRGGRRGGHLHDVLRRADQRVRRAPSDDQDARAELPAADRRDARSPKGFDQHISKGYIYFAMAFSVFVEMLNLRLRKTASVPVQLHEPYRQA